MVDVVLTCSKKNCHVQQQMMKYYCNNPITMKTRLTCHQLSITGRYRLDCWTGTLDWTDIFLVFTHSEVSFIESCLLRASKNLQSATKMMISVRSGVSKN